MEQDVKVFYSEITRGVCGERNNLYELLNVDPAKPVKLHEDPKSCTFQPKSDKYYECKKKSKLKVKTVRDIRNVFEKDIDAYLPQSLEKQRNVLLKRIRNGCSKDEDTKKMALNILKSENTILRTSWQMLMNINPEEHIHPVQYILWNGHNIRVCGSRGGSKNYIHNFNIQYSRDSSKNKKSTRKTILNKKKCLLRNSLSLKIKPGPLTQKKFIDDSYQKHHVGNLELVNLPKPGLDVMPAYGSSMEPTIRNFLHSLRDIDGIISQKWAEFAVSMVTMNKSNTVQLQQNSCTTFNLNYKYDQKKMLMRRDIEYIVEITNEYDKTSQVSLVKEDDILENVGKVLSEMIDSVEISLNQDMMYTGEDVRVNNNDGICNYVNSNTTNAKDKNKNKFGELGRLDVTVIRLPENVDNVENKPRICTNAHCILGCICESLNCAVIIKEHCGRLECMFQCQCDFSSYKDLDNHDSVSSDLLPGLYKLDKEINFKLSKEEKKFHQTVVFSGNKSILLKSHKRNWKASTKYSDFYKTMNLKINNKVNRNLMVVLTKINCDNIEPWCMVHNLYKCFCKGRFAHSIGEMEFKHSEASVNTVAECEKLINLESDVKSHQSCMQTRPQREKYRQLDKLSTEICSSKKAECEKTINSKSSEKSYQTNMGGLRPQHEKPLSISERKGKLKSDDLLSETYSIHLDLDDPMQSVGYKNTCARLKAYVGRKYTNRYYQQMNCKIREMEKDDISLHKRLNTLINIDQVGSKNIFSKVSENKDTVKRKESDRNKNRRIREIDENNPISPKVLKKSIASTISGKDEETSREKTPELNVDIGENILSGGFTTNDIEEKNQSKLVAWLEYSYKQYKKRCDLGLTKLTLQAPQPKKMTLLPWNFILERYKERKNLFLVTKQKPFRMFMAVNRDHPFLKDCININDIRFADLYNYPITVKKLITNATDLKDSFCILCGHVYCWELIGSVTKVDEPKNTDSLICDESICNDKSMEYINNENSHTESDPPISTDEEDTSDTKESQMDAPQSDLQSESSKWFVMTIEKDFSEIQFYKRGFFVKYDSIIKAINIARYSQKTVRLSSQKCAENNTNSQFGIYAIPNANEDCVFIGPYECNESLGIETIRSMTKARQLKRTRGYWITTNKIDNINVIDNPMSFMPTKDIEPNKILSLKSTPNQKKDSFSCIEEEPSNESDSHSPSKGKPNLVKPIKISKKNSFFPIRTSSLLRLPINNYQSIGNENTMSHLKTASTVTSVSLSDLLSKVSAHTSDEQDGLPTTSDLGKSLIHLDPDPKDHENIVVKSKGDSRLDLILNAKEIKSNLPSNVTAVALSDVLLKLNAQTSDEKEELPAASNPESKDDKNITVQTKGDSRPEGSFFAILKPEEINKRIMNMISIPEDSANNREECMQNKNDKDQEIEKDIENFLVKSSSIQDSNLNVYVISDDDEEFDNKRPSVEDVSAVWIESNNIENFGWISGLRNNKNKLISFQFPGFNFSAYYPQCLAFAKINQILSRKICVPTKMEIEWNVVEQKCNLKSSRKLECSDLGAHFVLTKHGPLEKRDIMKKISYSRKSNVAETAGVNEKVDPVIETLE